MFRAAALILLLAFGLPIAAFPNTGGSELALAELPALRLEAGGLARRQLVAIGRDLVVEGEALSHVVALDGSVEVVGTVGGDVITLGGDVRLAPGARVEGDIFVLGGRLEAAPDARVGGRSVSYPGVSGAFLTMLEAPALGLEATSPVVVGVKLALLTGWMAVLLVLFSTSGREMLSTSRCVIEEPVRAFGIGLTFVLAGIVTLVALNLTLAALIGIPFVFLVLLTAMLAKLWGMVAVFHAVGIVLARRLGRRRTLPLSAATLGLIVLGAIKLVPLLGLWVWWIATFIGIGASLVTKFGRREPWLIEPRTIAPALP